MLRFVGAPVVVMIRARDGDGGRLPEELGKVETGGSAVPARHYAAGERVSQPLAKTTPRVTHTEVPWILAQQDRKNAFHHEVARYLISKVRAEAVAVSFHALSVGRILRPPLIERGKSSALQKDGQISRILQCNFHLLASGDRCVRVGLRHCPMTGDEARDTRFGRVFGYHLG